MAAAVGSPTAGQLTRRRIGRTSFIWRSREPVLRARAAQAVLATFDSGGPKRVERAAWKASNPS